MKYACKIIKSGIIVIKNCWEMLCDSSSVLDNKGKLFGEKGVESFTFKISCKLVTDEGWGAG